MKILVIGSGGREQAIASKIASSEDVEKVYIIPGGKGLGEVGDVINLNLNYQSFDELALFAKNENIYLTIVGPDQALADGIVDVFEKHDLKIFGPSQKASKIESSKEFGKLIMEKADIPTAEYKSFTDSDSAQKFINEISWSGIVVKKDGLALGKGVIVCESKTHAKEVVLQFLESDESQKIIVEEFLEGPEVSHFALCDGNSFYRLGMACDYKRIRDDNHGPNTGGMGAYSPADWISEDELNLIEEKCVQPLISKMKEEGVPFKGVLFTGLMRTKDGPKVLEYNARFGDPETQCLLPLVDEDLLPIIENCIIGKGETRPIEMKGLSSVHLVAASYGYPGTEGVPVRKGDEIFLKNILPETHLFFAGVKKENERLFTNGGRVIGLTTLGKDREEAREKAYIEINKIEFQDMQYRSDIGK